MFARVNSFLSNGCREEPRVNRKIVTKAPLHRLLKGNKPDQAGWDRLGLFGLIFCSLLVMQPSSAPAGKLTVEISGPADEVEFVGAFQRWDEDGNLRRPVNPKAKIDAPEVDAVAKRTGNNVWVFENLPPGRYELVIMLRGKKRIEGWTYAPVLEFDPFIPPTAKVEDEEDRAWIEKDIRNSRHYENKVVPLAMAGDDKVIRVLMMLLRDLPTSYEAEMPGAATLRFEIWQYTWRYGGWVKERRTRVFHRIIMPRDQLRQWTWVWDPRLGDIRIGNTPATLKYELPDLSSRSLPGLYPY